MRRAVVTGAGGFLGSQMVRKLKEEGYWVRGVSRSLPQYSETLSDEFLCLNLLDEKKLSKRLKPLRWQH